MTKQVTPDLIDELVEITKKPKEDYRKKNAY